MPEAERDPRKMSVAELTALGHPPISRAAAIRANCLDCCGGNAAEVRRCAVLSCALWPFRLRSNPYRQAASEAA